MEFIKQQLYLHLVTLFSSIKYIIISNLFTVSANDAHESTSHNLDNGVGNESNQQYNENPRYEGKTI